MKSCITTSHLYGMGGGAKAVFACARAMARQGPVTIFTRTAIPESVLAEMPRSGIAYRNWYPGCTAGFDLHLNIDHFRYGQPLAVRNVAHIFHPHARNHPPEGYELIANSAYTKHEIRRLWDLEATVLYIPVEDDFYVGAKERSVLHVSRISAPTQYADKGHRQIIEAFRHLRTPGWRLVMAGAVDPNQAGYMSSLMSMALGMEVDFVLSPSRAELLQLYARAAIYWHMTGASMPSIPGAQEHLGLTTIEAMASGCVPVVRGTGGQPEIVEDRHSGVLIESVGDLARMTDAVISDMSLWSAIQQQAIPAGRSWIGESKFYERFDEAMSGQDNEPPGRDAGMEKHYDLDDVDIIIPIWNTTTLQRCLTTIPAGPNVIVVDNGSDVPFQHPRIDQYIRSEENLGFGGGNMLGFRHSTRPLVLALNDDCFPPDDGGMWLQWMLISMSQPDVGVVGSKLVYPDGRLQHAGLVFDWNRDDVGFHRWYGWEDHPNANQTTAIPAVTGACLLCKRELFDMRPDLYPCGNYEDAHLCLQAWVDGHRVVYQPASTLIHVEAATKVATGVDYVQLNKATFVTQWRDLFLDSVEMEGVREINRKTIAGGMDG